MNANKLLKWLAGLLLLAGLGIGSAWADHGHYGHGGYYGHGHFGVSIGVPLFPWYYPSPYYYPQYYPSYGPVVVERPPVYVEQAAPPQTAQAGYWYYCAGSKAYYPYVNECPGGWQRVAPQPPGQP